MREELTRAVAVFAGAGCVAAGLYLGVLAIPGLMLGVGALGLLTVGAWMLTPDD